MTYKIISNPDGTYTIKSIKIIANHITIQQVWDILASVDEHITVEP